MGLRKLIWSQGKVISAFDYSKQKKKPIREEIRLNACLYVTNSRTLKKEWHQWEKKSAKIKLWQISKKGNYYETHEQNRSL